MFSVFRRDGQNPSDQSSARKDLSPSESGPDDSMVGPAGGTLAAMCEGASVEVAVPAEDASVDVAEGPSHEAVPVTSAVSHTLPATDVPRAELPRVTESDASGQPGVEATREEDAAGDTERVGLTHRPRQRRLKGRRLARPEDQAAARRQGSFAPQQRLLLLDTWLRSGLPAKDFAALVGISPPTLYKWKQLFEEQGPAGLMDQPRGARRGSRLPEVTRRTILMLKQQHPEWGCQRISDMLVRGPALPASASAVARVLHEAGYEPIGEATRSHPPKTCRFERARPNQLWQTDLFTFVLKRHNRRVYLVAFLDDHSRFIVSYGLHASASTALVLEALEAGIAAWGPPEEILTDNGPQYVTWRGKSRFTRHLEKRGIRQILARPRRPQTLGKIERFWGTMWREFLETAVFHDLGDARTRIGHFMDYYNLQRPHQGLEGLVPGDRFFGAAPDVLRMLKERAQRHALEIARHGQPKAPFYVTGQVEGRSFSVHAEGERLVLTKEGAPRQEIELVGPPTEASSCVEPSEASASEALRMDAGATHGKGLPAPMCPSGAPGDHGGEPACGDPPAPGKSALDEQQLGRLLEESARQEPHEPSEDDGEKGGRS